VSLTVPLESDPECTLAFAEEPQLDFRIGSLIGYDYQLRDVPKISNFIINKIRSVIREEAVLPKAFSFHLPLSGRPLDLKQVLRYHHHRRVSPESIRLLVLTARAHGPHAQAAARAAEEHCRGVKGSGGQCVES
jgi:hypothetical protein